jgi:hypothetical protein
MKDTMRTIKAVTAERPALLAVRWSDGTRATIDIASMLDWLPSPRDPHEFAHVRIGVGTFYDFEAIGGRMIWVRNVWSRITSTSCHFEQAFSADGGKTWETNWMADDTRM